MRFSNYKTSNPAFTNYFWEHDENPDNKMSVYGIFIKCLFSIIIIASVTISVWKLYELKYDVSWFTLGGMLASIIISITISYKQYWAHILVPIYAIAKGCFLGGFSAFIKAKFPDMPYQAIGVTIVTFLVVLILYQTRIIIVTKQLRSIIISAAASIFLVYLVSFILNFFGIKTFIWGTSWQAITFNCIAAIVATFTFLLDFDYIERHKNRTPKHKEWIATWGLMVSLVWLYTEVLRLMRKLAIRF